MKTRRTAVRLPGPADPRTVPAGFRFRRERLGEWAVAVVLLLLAGLWLCWPAGIYRARVPARVPEPGAAFVVVEISGNPLLHRPDGLAHQGRDGEGAEPAFSLLPAMPPPPPPAPPAYTELAVFPPVPPLARAGKLAPPPLVEGPPLDPLPVVPAGRDRIVRLSPALQAAGFRFTEPGDLTGGVGRVRFQVLLGPDGRVAALLDEAPGEQMAARLVWRRALLLGAGATNASGSVEAEW